MNSTRRNVALLAACQAMLFANNTTLFTINALTGLALAPHPSLATLPMTCWVLGGALATMPASFHMKRVGRQRGLSLGTAWGVAGALGCAAAVWLQSYWLLCAATLLYGVFNAYGQYYRFAAADTAPPDYRATAISLVLAGGLVGGVIGPASSRLTVELLQPKFLAAYIGLIGFVLAATLLLQFIRIPNPTPAERAASGRPLREVAAQPKFIVAVLSAAIGYGVMNFLMTSTPIAMQVCGLSYGDTALVISSHVVGMFAPSFFTGHLIRRFGVLTIMLISMAVFADFLSPSDPITPNMQFAYTRPQQLYFISSDGQFQIITAVASATSLSIQQAFATPITGLSSPRSMPRLW